MQQQQFDDVFHAINRNKQMITKQLGLKPDGFDILRSDFVRVLTRQEVISYYETKKYTIKAAR